MAQLVPGETATVVVEVRSIASRPVRRRGMRPLVEATVADGSGTMKATFFNQPWLAAEYPPGTRLVLHGKFEARNRFRVQGHAPTDRGAAPAPRRVAHYPATEGLSSTQILALVREHAGALADVPEPLPARLRVAERLPGAAQRAGRGALRRATRSRRPGAGGWPSTSCCWSSSPCCAAARLRREGSRAPVLDGRARAQRAAGSRSMLPFAPTADQRSAMDEIDADLARGAADAAAADGRGRVGQDGCRALRAAARGRARLPGRADGAHRAAGRAALRHAPGADARGGGRRSAC